MGTEKLYIQYICFLPIFFNIGTCYKHIEEKCCIVLNVLLPPRKKVVLCSNIILKGVSTITYTNLSKTIKNASNGVLRNHHSAIAGKLKAVTPVCGASRISLYAPRVLSSDSAAMRIKGGGHVSRLPSIYLLLLTYLMTPKRNRFCYTKNITENKAELCLSKNYES